MNKKLVLAHVAAIYIAMVEVGNAGPPGIGPIAVETEPGNPLEVTVAASPNGPIEVETVDGNPLEVTVTNSTSVPVKIPFVAEAECEIYDGNNHCIAYLPALREHPEGTNTTVIQQINASIGALFELRRFFTITAAFEYNSEKFVYRARGKCESIRAEPVAQETCSFETSESVVIYSNGTPGDATPRVILGIGSPLNSNTSGGTLTQRAYIAGYHTWVDPE